MIAENSSQIGPGKAGSCTGSWFQWLCAVGARQHLKAYYKNYANVWRALKVKAINLEREKSVPPEYCNKICRI